MEMRGCENFRTFAVVGRNVSGVLPDGTLVAITSCPRGGRAHWLAQVLSRHQPMKRAIQRLIDVAERWDEMTVEARAESVAGAEKMLCWRPR